MPPMAFKGVVTKVGVMQKTATVTVSRYMLHPRTGKRIERHKNFLVHDEKDQLLRDDVVIIRNCPRLSTRKAFTLEKVMKSPEADRRIARSLMEQKMAQAAGSAVPVSELIRQHSFIPEEKTPQEGP